MDVISLLVLVILLILPLIFIKNYVQNREFREKVNKIPGPKTYPIIGNAIELAQLKTTDLVQYHKRNLKNYGPVNKFVLFNDVVVHLHSPEGYEIVLNGMKHLEKSVPYETIKDWLGEGLLTSKGAKWHKHRKMITPTFHFKILERFQEVMADKSNILIKLLEKRATANEVFDVKPYITNCALDIICETAMGTNIKAQDSESNEYVDAINKLGILLVSRLLRPWQTIGPLDSLTSGGRQWKACLKILHEFTSRVIHERKEERKMSGGGTPTVEDIDLDLGSKKRVAFLDLILDAADKDSSLTDLDIRQEVDTFMFEGHDTTTMAMTWAIYLLGSHPEIQERAYQELQEIYNGDDRKISFKDVSEMKYLERVIKESLRLYPSVPDFGRKCEQDIEIHGYTIPAGVNIEFHVYNLHRNPKYFPDPEVFNPDNFLPENVQDRHPYAYLPFSAGPRNCIGQKFAVMEEKTMLASILRRFKITSMEEPKDIPLASELVLRPQNGIKIKLEIRK